MPSAKASAKRLLIIAALVLQTASSEQAAPISVRRCSATRARLEWLRAETASLEAVIRDACEPSHSPSIEMPAVRTALADTVGSGVAALAGRTLAAPVSDAAATESANGMKHSVPPRSQQLASSTTAEADLANGGRRRESDLPTIFSVQCYRPGSSFFDTSCGCLGKPKSSEFDRRPTIKIVAGSWCASTTVTVSGNGCLRLISVVFQASGYD